MKRARGLFCAAIALLFVVATGTVGAEGEAISAEGEIVDLACYVSSGAKGADHAGCAKSCVKSGQPMGLLGDDGTLYLLYASHKDGEPFEAAKEHAGSKVQVSGKLSTRDGIKGIQVDAVKPL